MVTGPGGGHRDGGHRGGGHRGGVLQHTRVVAEALGRRGGAFCVRGGAAHVTASRTEVATSLT